MKKLIGVAVVLVLGSIITNILDPLLGIEFSGVSYWAQITHTTLYLLWGVAIASLFRHQEK